jgi:hypothetical protein
MIPPQVPKTHTQNITTMQPNHRQAKDKIPKPKQTMTTNNESSNKTTQT